MKKNFIPILLPIISIIAGIMLAGYITYDYSNECKNAKWPSTEATVVDMNSYVSSGGGIKSSTSKTIYIITYSYDINGEKYKGEVRSLNPIPVGNSIEIKYNPEAPSFSTSITTPDTERFVISLIFGIILIAAGIIFTTIIWKKRALLTYEIEDKPYYHEPKQKRNPTAYLKLLLPIGVFLLSIVLMYYQPFMQKNINADEFIQIMQSNGYESENSLDRLQTEFGMGSLIEQSYSVNTQDIRIDFCEINTSHNAEMLYNCSSLPAEKIVISKNNFTAAESNEFFYVKALKNNTFVYGACKTELKDKLLQLFEDMNYYSE